MQFRQVTESDLQVAADAARVCLTVSRTSSTRQGPVIRATLAPLGGDVYRRVSPVGRRIHAVCYHGHLAFMRALFARVPNAVVESEWNGDRMAYHSAAELERLAPLMQRRNIGSAMRPLPYDLACICHDYNVGGVLPDWSRESQESLTQALSA